MAEPLKNQFGTDVVQRIAAMLTAVHPQFAARPFIAAATENFEPLSLTQRARHIARALHRHLPARYEAACDILVASLGPKSEHTEGAGMAPFLYLPHVMFVADYGLDHFEASMRAQYELTQRFTAEFSIRAYLERHPQPTLARLRTWAADPSVHVRRLVSEGTRPRLPWAPRLRAFQADPRPVLELLELLKDDPELYVRRSVANNLNDIGKDHPRLLATVARRWLKGASAERRWLVHHALRSALKRAEPGALDALGLARVGRVRIDDVAIVPERPTIGGKVSIAFTLTNTAAKPQRVMADLHVHFVKADGATRAKVFKLATASLAPRARQRFNKTITLAQLTTRKHYAGRHAVGVALNGSTRPLGHFDLRARE